MNKQEIEKTIEELDIQIKATSCTVSIKSCELAISALEKQIPKQTIGIKAQMQNRYCPSCNEWMIFEKIGHTAYCPTCGQAIDWRNEDAERD